MRPNKISIVAVCNICH